MKKSYLSGEASMTLHRAVRQLLLAALFSSTSFAFGAEIVARVVFEGQPPPPKMVDLAADPYCLTTRPDGKLPLEEVQVGPEGRLKDTLVFVQGDVSGTFPAPTTAAVLDQVGCHYVPHLLGVMAGQPVLIKNSDDTLHNIHPLPMVNTPFNIGMPIKGMTQTKTFKKPEAPFHVRCDIHPWMGANIAVFTHPFFGVSDTQGVVDLKNLPAGTYTIQSWHEKYGSQSQQVTVGANDRTEIVFKYKAS